VRPCREKRHNAIGWLPIITILPHNPVKQGDTWIVSDPVKVNMIDYKSSSVVNSVVVMPNEVKSYDSVSKTNTVITLSEK
jgi:hypothetical protein